MEGTFVVGLMRHRNFVVAATPERVVLFDEHLNLQHEWSPSGSVVLAQATATDIVLLDGVLDRATGLYEATVRWLSLGDALEERAETPVPVAVAIHPPPKLLVGPTGLALVVHDGSDNWRECRLPQGHGEFECQQPAWGRDLKALHGMFQSALVNVVRSADGYVVTVPYGCAIWSRRYD